MKPNLIAFTQNKGAEVLHTDPTRTVKASMRSRHCCDWQLPRRRSLCFIPCLVRFHIMSLVFNKYPHWQSVACKDVVYCAILHLQA